MERIKAESMSDPMGETKHGIMKAQNRWPRSVVKLFVQIMFFQWKLSAKVKASIQYWTTSKT